MEQSPLELMQPQRSKRIGSQKHRTKIIRAVLVGYLWSEELSGRRQIVLDAY